MVKFRRAMNNKEKKIGTFAKNETSHYIVASANRYFRSNLTKNWKGAFVFTDAVEKDLEDNVLKFDKLLKEVSTSPPLPNSDDTEGAFKSNGITYLWHIWALKEGPQTFLESIFLKPTLKTAKTSDPDIGFYSPRCVLVQRDNDNLEIS